MLLSLKELQVDYSLHEVTQLSGFSSAETR